MGNQSLYSGRHSEDSFQSCIFKRSFVAGEAEEFWPADIDYATAISPFSDSVVGHKQVSDVYLLGLALHRRGKFATLDHRVRTMLPESSKLRDTIIEI